MKSSFFVHIFAFLKFPIHSPLFLENWLGTRRKINQARLQNLQKTCQANPELSLHEEMHNAQAKSLYTSPAESYFYQGQGHHSGLDRQDPGLPLILKNRTQHHHYRGLIWFGHTSRAGPVAPLRGIFIGKGKGVGG